MSTPENPCLSCPDTCCGIPGKFSLRLSKQEFENFFRDKKQDLLIEEKDKVVMIYSKEGKVCPNLDKKGCRIYLDRPIDCRLYPYQMLPLYETRHKVKILLYIKPECVENRIFNIPENVAMDLVVKFGRKVYGNKKIIVQIFEDKFLPKLKNKIELLFVNFCQKFGINL
ncbi:YkgJ family cysteine cluster protein [Thermodesulfobacteriota bacterium]